jgi:hypothetical protein
MLSTRDQLQLLLLVAALCSVTIIIVVRLHSHVIHHIMRTVQQ